MSTEQNKAIVRRYLEQVYNKNNPSVLNELLAPNYKRYLATGAALSLEEQRQRLAGELHRARQRDLREQFGDIDLRTATARVEEARAQYGIARSFLFPQVGLAAGYDAQQTSRLSEPPQGTARGKTFQNYSAGFPVSWEIDLFGRIRSEKAAAFAAYLATEQGRRAAIVTLVGDVASTYILIRELDLQLGVRAQLDERETAP